MGRELDRWREEGRGVVVDIVVVGGGKKMRMVWGKRLRGETRCAKTGVISRGTGNLATCWTTHWPMAGAAGRTGLYRLYRL